jgi:peptidoglycan/xylan/chitin deacetylase (PgdA/CDA1 family)
VIDGERGIDGHGDAVPARVLIVMYHYVRDLARSRYPRIRGRDADAFARQIEHLARHHTLIAMDDLLCALDGEHALPADAALLTFDDGLREHYDVVFPLLWRRGIPAAFYPPSRPILEGRVLDVHKLHFVLASAADGRDVERALFTELGRIRGERAGGENGALERDEAYRARCAARPSRWDAPEINVVKRMLQVELPAPIRARIVRALFDAFVGVDEGVFAHELYATIDQLAGMVRAGMHIGSHGHAHVWLDALPAREQEDDLRASLRLLDAVQAPRDRWTVSYPYGGHDAATIDVVTRLGFRAALTVEPALARVEPARRFRLARLDTNDVPCDAAAPPGPWTHAQRETGAPGETAAGGVACAS